MKTWWASASVLALCVSPVLAQARDRDRGRDRRDDGGRATAESRHPRPSRGWNRERSDRGGQRSQSSADRPAWTGRQTRSGFNGPEVDRYLLRRVEVYGRDNLWQFRHKLKFGANEVSTFYPLRYYAGRISSRLGF